MLVAAVRVEGLMLTTTKSSPFSLLGFGALLAGRGAAEALGAAGCAALLLASEEVGTAVLKLLTLLFSSRGSAAALMLGCLSLVLLTVCTTAQGSIVVLSYQIYQTSMIFLPVIPLRARTWLSDATQRMPITV